jgi:hypothetical protein
MFYLFF